MQVLILYYSKTGNTKKLADAVAEGVKLTDGVDAVLKNTDEVIVGLGAGAAVKKNIDEAKESISSQKKELEDLMNKMSADMQKLTDFIVTKSPEAEALLKKLESQEAQQQ